MKVRLSEDFEVVDGLDGDYYVLNHRNGDWKEISCIEAEALRLLDGKRTVEEVIDTICQEFPEHGTSEDDRQRLMLFFKDCLKTKILRKISVLGDLFG